jgi:uncharacterized protein with von Willebrand factor type A (vWA) domain
MLTDFFLHLKARGLPVSTREYLSLLEALDAGLIAPSVDEFYTLSRMTLVKDESLFDKFDRAFGEFFRGIDALPGLSADIPEEWLRQQARRLLTPEERAKLEKLGWDKLMEEFKKRLAEQKERHQGGNKWIGAGGTSPFGAHGYHPEGIRIGPESAGNRTAVKVWDQRQYRNLDDSVELGTRNIKLALRKLRRFAREGAAEELDLDDTISATARNAGWLDLKMRPERHNAVKVLLFFDIGGSMDDHVRVCEELFSACRGEFKHLEYFYFHNCIYEAVWRDNGRRDASKKPLDEVLHTYGPDYKLVVVGDATMSPYEIMVPGGSVEHYNREPGAETLRRLFDAYPASCWINPQPEGEWDYRQSIALIRKILGDAMFPLTLDGLTRAMRHLTRRH